MDFSGTFVDILLWTLWIWLIFAFFMVMFRVFGDLFSDQSLGGMAKFGWSVFIIFLPFLGLLVYVLARGKGMAEREQAKMSEMQAAQAAYIRQAAGTGSSATDQIASAKAMLDAGTITAAEFDALKSKALAA
jgi:hypothetical protein